MLLQLVQTGQYDLLGGTFVRDSTMTSVRTWNELIRKEQCQERSMEYDERWDKIDHFIPLTPVQAQPHQFNQSSERVTYLCNQQSWKSSPYPSQSSSWPQSSPKWSSAIEILEPKSIATRSPRGRFKPVGETTDEERKDPTFDEYHTHMERKTMTTKPNKSEYCGKTCQGSKSLESSEKKASTPASQFNLYQ